MRVVAAVPACGILAGCAIGVAWPDRSHQAAALLLALSVVAAGLAFLSRRSSGVGAAVAVGCLCAGILLADAAWHAAWRSPLRVAFESIARDARAEARRRGEPLSEDQRAAVVLVGVLREDAAVTDGGAVSLSVAVRWIGRAIPAGRAGGADLAANPAEGGVLLTVGGTLAADRMGEWRRGRTIRTFAQLRRPTRYLDPGVPDQERALARRGVALVGTVKSAALVEVVGHGGAASEAAAAGRAFVRRAIASAVGQWRPRSAAIVTAILIGDRTGLEPDVVRRLQEAGTYHVIAISGGNIAILAGLTLTVFRVAGLLGRGAMVTAIAGLLAYGAFVSGGASVDRATFMATVYFAGRALDLRGPPLNALALVGGLLVAGRPLSVADPAFLLTFGASAAILAIPTGRSRLPRLLAPVVALGLASLAAEAALFPVSALLFSRVTFAGLALNFLAIPLMAIAQVAGMAAVPIFAISPWAAGAVGFLAHAGADGLVRSADLVRFVPQVTWRVAPPTVAIVAVYYAAGLLWWTLRRRRRDVTGSGEGPWARRARPMAAAAALSAAAWVLWEPWALFRSGADGRLHVTFVDVGQGDAALVRFPGGATMLVDAGGIAANSSFDVGDRVVGPVLRSAGVRRLGTAVLTHGDADHVGGASAVLAEFRPWDVWEGTPVPSSAALRSLRGSAAASGARWTRVQAADETTIDGVTVVVHHPELPDWERQRVRNDDSIVIELAWRDVSLVLTGDIGADTERRIAVRFRPAGLRVLKVAHHGSASSSSETFLRALRPRLAVVSVGRSNTFGHPAPAVVRRYESIGAELLRTDRDGAITIDTDGRSLDVRTFTGRRLHYEVSKTRKHEISGLPDAQTSDPSQ